MCNFKNYFLKKFDSLSKSIKIGIVFISDTGWTGGMDYTLNLINALSYLPSDTAPEVRLFVDDTVNNQFITDRLYYPKYHISRIKRYDTGIIGRVVSLVRRIAESHTDLKIIYPFPKSSFYTRYFSKIGDYSKVYWIPDFQEEYFPDFFSREELERRRRSRAEILGNPKCRVVLSSEAAMRDKSKFYPYAKARVEILHFANPSKIQIDEVQRDSVFKKYKIDKNTYFICPNQFWKHKNHKIIIEAIKILKSNGTRIKVLLTGREEDSRDPNYFPSLKRSVEKEQLTKEIQFLGFIPKDDLYTLMSFSKAMIQPSLFEGWSTTIEDAIALNVPVICSNLEVNREQLAENATYFDPYNPEELANILQKTEHFTKPDINQIDRVTDFALQFLKLADVK